MFIYSVYLHRKKSKVETKNKKKKKKKGNLVNNKLKVIIAIAMMVPKPTSFAVYVDFDKF